MGHSGNQPHPIARESCLRLVLHVPPTTALAALNALTYEEDLQEFLDKLNRGFIEKTLASKNPANLQKLSRTPRKLIVANCIAVSRNFRADISDLLYLIRYLIGYLLYLVGIVDQIYRLESLWNVSGNRNAIRDN
ncbi:hypothetical protein Trydic_g8679 [Trypoxylus dichotomus]